MGNKSTTTNSEGRSEIEVKLDDQVATSNLISTPKEIISIGDLTLTNKILGVGFFGTVFEGKWHHQSCAAKVLSPLGQELLMGISITHEDTMQEESLKTFKKECEFMKTFQHPNIVAYYDTLFHPRCNLPVLVMELMHTSLRKFIGEGAIMSTIVQVSLSCDVVSALEYLHERGLVHRDLCGDNVLLNYHQDVPVAKITDFGLSRIILKSGQLSHSLSALGHRPGCLPPEVMSDPTDYDSSLDIFMFGVIMTQIARKVASVDKKHQREELVAQLDNHILKPFIDQCLKENRRDRCTAIRLHTDLHSLLVSFSVSISTKEKPVDANYTTFPDGISWSDDQHHCALGSRDVLIIAQTENLQQPDVIPRRSANLAAQDVSELEKLHLVQNDNYDDASIMVAKYVREDRFTDVKVEKTEPKKALKKTHILNIITTLLKNTQKDGVVLHYTGPGRKSTGDWCFEDGFLTFRDITELYIKHFRGKVLTIQTDCSYAGCWVSKFVKFLDAQQVKPCGHSAREKGILLKVFASCQLNEVPYTLLYSARANESRQNKKLVVKRSGWKIADRQHVKRIDATNLICDHKDIKEPCTVHPNLTWQKWNTRERVHLIRENQDGQPAWSYVLVSDEDSTGGNLTQSTNEVLKSGLGENPPIDVVEWIERCEFA